MNHEEIHKYDDIIHLSHHVSKKHPQMPPLNRAAQFSPFAALTGHDAAVKETSRLTEPFAELSDDRKEQLDEQLQRIRKHLENQPEIEFTYFEPDIQKNGGSYVTISGRVKRIDEYSRKIILNDERALLIERICSISGEIF